MLQKMGDEMECTRARLGREDGVDEQCVSRWGRKKSKLCRRGDGVVVVVSGECCIVCWCEEKEGERWERERGRC